MKRLNKKGFTLVELLAVIAILAILMLIIMPNILNMFNEGRQNAFITQVQRVWRAAEQDYMNKSMSQPSATPSVYSSDCGTITDKKICDQLSISDTSLNYCVVIDKSLSKVSSITVSDSNYYLNTGVTSFDVKDTDTTVQDSASVKKVKVTATTSGDTTTYTCGY